VPETPPDPAHNGGYYAAEVWVRAVEVWRPCWEAAGSDGPFGGQCLGAVVKDGEPVAEVLMDEVLGHLFELELALADLVLLAGGELRDDEPVADIEVELVAGSSPGSMGVQPGPQAFGCGGLAVRRPALGPGGNHRQGAPYNDQRPHQAIDMAVPARLFRPGSQPEPAVAVPAPDAEPSGPAPVLLGAQSAGAVEFDTVISASGVLGVLPAVQRIKMGPARAAQLAHVWVDGFTLHAE
jgi:hypothetical protein